MKFLHRGALSAARVQEFDEHTSSSGVGKRDGGKRFSIQEQAEISFKAVGLITDIFSGLPAKFFCSWFNQCRLYDLGDAVSKGRLVHALCETRLPHPLLPLCLTDLETEPAT